MSACADLPETVEIGEMLYTRRPQMRRVLTHRFSFSAANGMQEAVVCVETLAVFLRLRVAPNSADGQAYEHALDLDRIREIDYPSGNDDCKKASLNHRRRDGDYWHSICAR